MNFRELNRKKNLFIRSAKSNLVKLLVDRKRKEPFVLSSIKKVVFLRNDNKLGDMVVSTMSFREAKKAGFEVSVIAGTNTTQLLSENPYVDHAYTYKSGLKNVFKLALELRKKQLDLLIDIGDEPRAETLFLLALMNPKHILGFNKSNYKMYDVLLSDPVAAKNHITYRHTQSLEKLGVTNAPLQYDIPVPSAVEREIKEFLISCSHKLIVINMFTASKHRDLSVAQLRAVVNQLQKQYSDLSFVLIGTQDRLKNVMIDGVKKSPFDSLFHAIALIKQAWIVLSPDTAVVHLAQAFDKPLVALYQADPENIARWSPVYDKAHLILTESKLTDVAKIPDELITNQLVNLIEAIK